LVPAPFCSIRRSPDDDSNDENDENDENEAGKRVAAPA
jgi:hypothetical protein